MRERFERTGLREAALDRAARRDLVAHLTARVRAGAPTHVYARRARLAIYGAVAAFFAAAGALLAGGPDLSDASLGRIAWVVAAAAVAGGARAWRMRHVPVAVFSAEGVRFRGPFVEQSLAWEDLGGAFIVSNQRRFHVALVPRNVDAVLAAATPWRRRWLLSNLGTIGAPFALPASSELPARELFAVLRAYADARAPEAMPSPGPLATS